MDLVTLVRVRSIVTSGNLCPLSWAIYRGFYQLSQKNDYIKLKAIAKNIAYRVPSDYGELEITINLSKPEKDPKESCGSQLVQASNYPQCQLCLEKGATMVGSTTQLAATIVLSVLKWLVRSGSSSIR